MSVPTSIEAGQEWTFVHRGGKRVGYRIGDLIAPRAGGNDAMWQIINVETGGVGYVTERWLRSDSSDRRGWFEFVAYPQVAA